MCVYFITLYDYYTCNLYKQLSLPLIGMQNDRLLFFTFLSVFYLPLANLFHYSVFSNVCECKFRDFRSNEYVRNIYACTMFIC